MAYMYTYHIHIYVVYVYALLHIWYKKQKGTIWEEQSNGRMNMKKCIMLYMRENTIMKAVCL